MCILSGNVLYQWLFLFYWGAIVISIFINCVAILTVLCSEIRPNISYARFLNSTYVEDTKQLRLIYRSIGSSGRIILRVIGNNVEPIVSEELVKYMVRFMMDQEDDQGAGEGEVMNQRYKQVPLFEQTSSDLLDKLALNET